MYGCGAPRWEGSQEIRADRAHSPAGSTHAAAPHTLWSGQFEVCAPQAPDGPLLTSARLPFDEARLLVRVVGEPVGFVRVALRAGYLDPELVLRAIERELATRVERELRLAGAPSLAAIRRAGGSASVASPDWVDGSRATPVSAIVCTRNRGDALRPCLDSLMRLEHGELEIIVVDNAPTDESTADLVGQLAGGRHRVRYVREDRPGLSRARNRGLREATGEIIAYIDDDARADPLWVAGLMRGFKRHAGVGCVTGLVVSARLESAVEQYAEARAWWLTRCEPRLISATRGPGDSRLHPYDTYSFGTGANMAFRATVIREVGGFDECLGAGVPTAGGEDLDAFARVLLSGRLVGYEPAALVWHEHRATEHDLQRQMYGRGKGLAAYLTKYLLSRRSGPELAVRSLAALWHLGVLVRRSRTAADRTVERSRVLRSELRGLLVGPLVYGLVCRARGRDRG